LESCVILYLADKLRKQHDFSFYTPWFQVHIVKMERMHISSFTNLGAHLIIKRNDETWLNETWSSQSRVEIDLVTPRDTNESRQVVWRDSVCHVRCDFFQFHRVH
jgi:hypothetical protein